MKTKVLRITGRKAKKDILWIGNKKDNKTVQVRFELPEFLKDASICLHLQNGEYVDDVHLDKERVWVLTRTHTQYSGIWTAWIEAFLPDDAVWHSDPFRLSIGDNPEDDGEKIQQAYPSAFEKAFKAVDRLINATVRAVTLKAGSEATAEVTVDDDGNITIIYGIPQGEKGERGYTPRKGIDYFDGYTPKKGIDYVDGASAYEIAKENGFEGTETEWLESLRGKNGYTPVKNKDYFDGTNGKSAYEIAKENGFEGTETEWLKSLKGDPPTAGVDYYGKEDTEKLIDEKLGDISTGDASGQINAHNTAKDAHSDIRALIDGKQPKGDYALKSEIPAIPEKVSAFQNDAGYLTQHQDLSGYALKSEIPDVSAQVNAHNTATDAHSDMRLTLADLAARLNALANSDDTTLDQMAEVVAYIKDNRDLIEQVTTNKVNVTDIVDNLTTNVANKPLSAAQGVTLKTLIDALNTALSGKQPSGDYALKSEIPAIPTKVSAFENDSGYLTEHQDLSGYALKTELPEIPENVSAFKNDAGYLTEHQDLSGYVTQAEFVEAEQQADELEGRVTELEEKGGADGKSAYEIALDHGFEGTEEEWLASLDGRDGESGVYYGTTEPTAENHPVWIDPNGEADVIPTKVSQLENDAGYLTEHQSLDGYAKKSDIPSVPTKTSQLTNDSGFVTTVNAFPFYASPAAWGCAMSDTLDTVVKTMPNNSSCDFWVNASSSWSGVYNDILPVAKENGKNDAFGVVKLCKRSSVCRVQWESYNTLLTLVRQWKSVNAETWTEWRVIIPLNA